MKFITLFSLSLCLMSPNAFSMDNTPSSDAQREKQLRTKIYNRNQEYKKQQFSRQKQIRSAKLSHSPVTIQPAPHENK